MTLLFVYTRFHFGWRPTAGALVALNGTQPIITFSQTYHIPTVRTGALSQFIKPINASISYPFNQNAQPPFIPGTWYYPVTNGGAHTLLLWLDPASPPGSGPTAYENDAAGYGGPTDPLILIGDTTNIQIGLAAGLITTFAIFGFFMAIRIDVKAFKRLIRT